MINITQVILVVVITTLTILLTVIGVQIAYILKDLRHALKRVNRIIDDAQEISSAVVRPVSSLSNLVDGIQSSVKIAELLGLIKTGAKKTVAELPAHARAAKDAVVAGSKRLTDRLQEAEEEMSAAGSSEDPDQETETSEVSRPKHHLNRFFHRSGTPLG